MSPQIPDSDVSAVKVPLTYNNSCFRDGRLRNSPREASTCAGPTQGLAWSGRHRPGRAHAAPPRPPPPAGSSCAQQAVWVSVARQGVRNRLGAGAAALCVPARAVRPWGPWLPSGGRVLMRSRSSGRRGHAWCGGPGPTRGITDVVGTE
jgi:hypothetical protein